MFWKIQNQSDQEIRVAIATSSHTSKGVILQPNEFCVSIDQLTRVVDMQEKRGYLKIYRNYKNKNEYELGEPISEDPVKMALKNTNKYTGK